MFAPPPSWPSTIARVVGLGLAALGAACAVPHAARVPSRGYLAASAGGGISVDQETCDEDDVCSRDDAPYVSPTPAAQVTVGYGWRDRAHPVLAYVTAPVIGASSSGRSTPDTFTEAAGHVGVTLLFGTSAGAYVEVAGGDDHAAGVGAVLNLASTALFVVANDELSHPAGQLYLMAGGRHGTAWLDGGVRGGVTIDGGYGGGGFGAARWDRDGYRAGVWIDVVASTGFDLPYEDGSRVEMPLIATAGLLIETW